METYHMSKAIHPIGRILTGTGVPKVAKEVEDALEHYRPRDCFDRLNSVYTREIPDFNMLGLDCGYIYLFEIDDTLQRHDACWVGQLQRAQLKQKYAGTVDEKNVQSYPDWTDEFVLSCCCKYWAGTSSQKTLWELLSGAAEVKKLLSKEMVPVAATKGGWKIPDDA